MSHRKACASYTTCLIVSAGYQPFCVPGRVGSVCITCCNTHLCNGPQPPRISMAPPHSPAISTTLMIITITVETLLWHHTPTCLNTIDVLKCGSLGKLHLQPEEKSMNVWRLCFKQNTGCPLKQLADIRLWMYRLL